MPSSLLIIYGTYVAELWIDRNMWYSKFGRHFSKVRVLIWFWI